MIIKFRKEASPSDGMKGGAKYSYRSLERPEFVVCAEGFEWATGLGDVAVGETAEVEIKPVEITCRRCHGTGRLRVS